MAVCNIFKKFDSGTNGQGIFFTFSQYAEDLTQESSLQSEYRVVPSKFVCLDLDLDRAKPEAVVDDDGYNIYIPQTLQSYYENKISYFRGQDIYTDTVTNTNHHYEPQDATKYLFTFLRDKGFIHSEINTDVNPNYNYYPEVKYIGDINIYANENLQDINYNEIYCMVPADAKRYFYKNDLNTTSTPHAISEDLPEFINGWNGDTYPSRTELSSDPEFDEDTPTVSYNTVWELPSILNDPLAENYEEDSDDPSFDFNCIIVLYDVYTTNSDDTISKEVYCAPLGIWFSGDVLVDDPDNPASFSLKNSVTKFVRSDSVFEQGTSYGLRICTKFIANPLGTGTVIPTIDPNTDTYFAEFAEVCDQFSQAIIEMNNFNRILADEHTNMVDYITQFTNQRVNVPYIREVNGIPHWFVNGRDTGVAQYIPE